jgi:hypothetical protein
MPRFSWSEENVIQLKALIAEKLTAGRIAAILSGLLKVRISKNSVIGKCHRDGIELAQTRGGRPRNRTGRRAPSGRACCAFNLGVVFQPRSRRRPSCQCSR